METVTLWNVAAYGWSCVGEQDFGVTAVSTWTRDEQVLVLVWQGNAEVSAAVLDGESIVLDELSALVTSSDHLDNSLNLLVRAEYRATQMTGRLGTELAAVLEATAQAIRRDLPSPINLRNSVRNLALAVLSSPTK